ncbi:MAG TPA: hypothetical protein VF268_09740 [Gammaproteobacteria bacterium]
MITFQHILFDSLVVLFFVMGIVAAAVGVGLVVRSEKMFRLFSVMNRYVSTRKSLKPVSVPHDIGPVVQRYRWWFTLLILAGAVYSLYGLIANFDTMTIAAVVMPAAETDVPYAFAISVVEGLRWFMVVMSVIALAVGVMLGFFPGALGRIEASANRWYSVRKAVSGADNMYLTLDQWVEAFPRAAGLAITLGALIVIVSSGVTLFR